jgi:hypothetical protein
LRLNGRLSPSPCIVTLVAIQEVQMLVDGLETPALRVLPRALLSRACDWWWWSVRTHMADRHFLPRPPPPASPTKHLVRQ